MIKKDIEAKAGENRVNWRKLALESMQKQDDIYCHILLDHVKICKLVSCEHYDHCHRTI